MVAALDRQSTASGWASLDSTELRDGFPTTLRPEPTTPSQTLASSAIAWPKRHDWVKARR